MNEEKPVMFSWLNDPKKLFDKFAPDRIYEKLMDEIYDPNILRSHVITLHLYTEYWIDKMIQYLSLPNEMYWRKINALSGAGVFEKHLFENLKIINQLRNIYAHELDLETVTEKVNTLISQLQRDPYFLTTEDEPFTSICVQTMFMLEATYNNGCKPPTLPEFPHKENKEKLLHEGKIFWQDCQILKQEKLGEYETNWHLKCPSCESGTIIRYKDNTPGFKEADFTACNNCGLSGDGSWIIDAKG